MWGSTISAILATAWLLVGYNIITFHERTKNAFCSAFGWNQIIDCCLGKVTFCLRPTVVSELWSRPTLVYEVLPRAVTSLVIGGVRARHDGVNGEGGRSWNNKSLITMMMKSVLTGVRRCSWFGLDFLRPAAGREAMYSSVGCWAAPSIGGFLCLLFLMALMLIYVIFIFEIPLAQMYVDFEFEWLTLPITEIMHMWSINSRFYKPHHISS